MKRPTMRVMVERLEAREVPAGNVMAKVSGGNLIINGDKLGNGMEIVTDGTPGMYTVRGVFLVGEPTTVNGAAEAVFTGVTKDVKINAKEGDDFVFLRGDPVPLTLPRHLSITTTRGDDNILIQDTTVTGRTAVDSGHGNDTIQFIRSTCKNSVSVKGQRGEDLLGMFASTFEGIVAVEMGGEMDKVLMGREEGSLDGSLFKKAVRVTAGGGDDRIESFKSRFEGAFTGMGESGADTFFIKESVFTTPPIRLNGGTGTDVLTEAGNTFAAPPIITSIP